MIAIGSDHAGYELKEQIKQHLQSRGIDFKDFGTYSLDSCNYPDIAVVVSKAVAANDYERGILVCGTGVGMSMAANKVKGIRAACCSDTFSARFTRMHNDANMLCLGGRVVGSGLACDMVDLFVDVAFEGGKHKTRVDMIMAIEKD